MKAPRFALLVLFGAAYGVLQAQKDAASLDFTFSGILALVIVAWLSVSRILLRFIDRRNHSRRIQGLAGFLALLLGVFVIELLAFRLKVKFDLASGASASFRTDSAWLVLLPVIAYYYLPGKRANQIPEPTPGGVAHH